MEYHINSFIDLKDSVEDSLKDFSMPELQSMNDDLIILIDSLIQRQIALQEVIFDRLDNAFHQS
jgi:hypothetical protein